MLGYEDLNDNQQLRHDPVLAVLAGKAEPDPQALAGKSTLNRMELSAGTPNRYKKITFWRDGIDDLLVDVFLEAARAPRCVQIALESIRPITPFMASKKDVSITAIAITTAIRRYTCLLVSMCCASACGRAMSIARPEAAKRSSVWWRRFALAGRK